MICSFCPFSLRESPYQSSSVLLSRDISSLPNNDCNNSSPSKAARTTAAELPGGAKVGRHQLKPEFGELIITDSPEACRGLLLGD